MITEPLGTLRSWWLHAIVAGTLSAPCTLLGIVPVRHVLEGQLPDQRQLPAELLLLAMIGAVLGLLLGPVAYRLALWGWRHSVLLSLCIGPALGALSALCALNAAAMVSDGHWLWLRWYDWLAFASFGATVLGPPWVGYLVVRARGRYGHGVVAAIPVWALAVGGAFIAAVEIGLWL